MEHLITKLDVMAEAMEKHKKRDWILFIVYYVPEALYSNPLWCSIVGTIPIRNKRRRNGVFEKTSKYTLPAFGTKKIHSLSTMSFWWSPWKVFPLTNGSED